MFVAYFQPLISILFERQVEARKFRSTLEQRVFSFCIISSISVSETYEEVVKIFLLKFWENQKRDPTFERTEGQSWNDCRSKNLCSRTFYRLIFEFFPRLISSNQQSTTDNILKFLMNGNLNGKTTIIAIRLCVTNKNHDPNFCANKTSVGVTPIWLPQHKTVIFLDKVFWFYRA